jgi:hypothetical protein
MKKRCLADIHPDHYRQFEAIQKKLKQRGELVPTIPHLIRTAIEYGMAQTVARFDPPKK